MVPHERKLTPVLAIVCRFPFPSCDLSFFQQRVGNGKNDGVDFNKRDTSVLGFSNEQHQTFEVSVVLSFSFWKHHL